MTRELGDHHRRMLLDESAIAPDVIAERGYFTVERKTDLAELGFSRALQYVPTLVIPVHGVVKDEPPWYMHRPDETPVKSGRPRKYLIPQGQRMAVDVHPRVHAALGDPKLPLFITEGCRKGDALISAGARAVISLAGVWNWRGKNDRGGRTLLPDWEWVHLPERQVLVVYDSDAALKPEVQAAMDRLGAALNRAHAQVAFVYLPAAADGGKTGADDFLARGGTLDEIVERATSELRRPAALRVTERQPIQVDPVPLGHALAVYQHWLHLPDPEPLYVCWGTVASNRLPGDPVWTLLVGASGGGKTEIVRACTGLHDCAQISTLTEAGLLSGTPHADRSEYATGGVLRLIGARGVITAKDFTSILAMQRDTRAATLGAFREVYDGQWTRQLGTDGGRQLEWSGKAGLIGGVTHEIDRQHSVMATMGQRLLLYRLPHQDEDDTVMQALANSRLVDQMRKELARAALGVFAGLPKLPQPAAVTEDERDWLVALAKFVARGRGGVLHDPRGDLESVVEAEVPTRLAMELEALLAGMDVIGVPRNDALRAVTNTGLGCIPNLRRHALAYLHRDEQPLKSSEIATGLGHPSRTVRRALEALNAHGLVSRTSQGPGKADLWSLNPTGRAVLERAEQMAEATSMSVLQSPPGKTGTVAAAGTVPENPGGYDSTHIDSQSSTSKGIAAQQPAPEPQTLNTVAPAGNGDQPADADSIYEGLRRSFGERA